MNLIEFGDCRETMRRWHAKGIQAQTCVTSPPYYGLRDYGHEGQLGQEETPEQFVSNMIEVFRCVRDVLADDGTLWLNIGDSYVSTSTYNAPRTTAGFGRNEAPRQPNAGIPLGLKAKDLIGIPWMLAFALRADGWYLRQDIIWSKPNPMPESVRDRCTKAHEYVFMLTKQARYFVNSEGLREPSITGATANQRSSRPAGWAIDTPHNSIAHQQASAHPKTRSARDSFKRDGSKREAAIPGQAVGTHRPDREESGYDTATRNRRSVWEIASKPYVGAHFATFPPELPERCILMASRPGDIVLDPFMGSGTTAAAAQRLGRAYLGCELNQAYEALQAERLRQPSLALEVA